MTLDMIWPLGAVAVHTPRLTLRVPGELDLAEAARLAAKGVYDPVNRYVPRSPVGGWTGLPTPEAERAFLQYVWAAWADWRPERWNLILVAEAGGDIVGVQEIGAKDFAVSRTVSTGSWVGRDFQQQGFGTEMRRAVLHLAFAGLGAAFAESAAWESNAASLGVSRALGYRDNGFTIRAFEGEPRRQVNLILAREVFPDQDDITLSGLDPEARAMFGLPDR